MKRQLLFLALTAAAFVLGTSSKAHAWGAFHAGYTHVGYGGIQHYGTTSISGPYRSYSGSHYTSAGYGGAYHYGSANYSSGYHYGGVSGGGYAAGGYHYGSYSGYNAGVYRRW